MAWFDEAVFYHIYPLGLTGAEHENHYDKVQKRFDELIPWIDHVKKIGCNAIYIGPLFESGSHGYDTTDYKKVDSRLGTNEDLADFVRKCHEQGIKVILDGVFNHTGRDFFAFKDIKEKRENSQYKDWYCNVNFGGNNEYNDGFSYENWGGYNLLVKLNQWNPAVQDYICKVIKFWVDTFDIDGLRLDAADVLDFGFMRRISDYARSLKNEFYMMGEVIHGEYIRWERDAGLDAVTNYELHKGMFSGHNEHNYFEIAHTVRRLYQMGGNTPLGLRLYNFVDNHDVSRIPDKLNNRADLTPVYILLYTLPGVPSLYYGSEFAIEGKKGNGDDWNLRPAIALPDYSDAFENNEVTKLITKLGNFRLAHRALSYGEYKELVLTNRQYAFSRSLDGENIYVVVNNDDNPATVYVPAAGGTYRGLLSDISLNEENGNIKVDLAPHSGEIFYLV